MKNLSLLLALIAIVASSYGQKKISALRAPAHLGDSVAVFDKVYSSRVFPNGMTLLNLGARYPNQLLVVFISPEAKQKFTYKPEDFF